MSALFHSPKSPPPPEPVPTIDDASRMREESDNVLRRRKGRAASILTGPQGAGLPTTGTKVLTGE